MEQKKIIPIVILLIIIMFYFVNNIYFILNNKVYPDNEAGKKYRETLGIYKYIQDFEFKQAFFNTGYYPPLFNLVSVPFLFLYGKSYNSANLANLVFLIVLILSVYGIAKECKDRFAGYLSVLILFAFPQLIGQSRQYMSDFALAAMVCLSVYFLIKTKSFTKRKESIIFGITLALGMLTKWTFIFFIIGPMIYVILINFRKRNRKEKLVNLFISIVIGLFISLTWYLPKFNHLFSTLYQYSTFNSRGFMVNPDVLGFIIGYVKILALEQLYHVFFFIFILCFVYILLYKRKHMLFIFWFIIPLLIFSLFQSNVVSGRYILPYIPSAAVIISLAISEIKFIGLRKILVIALVILAISHYLLFSYSPSFGKELSFNDNRREYFGCIKLPVEVDKTSEKIKFVESCKGEVNVSVITDYGRVGCEKVHLSIIEDFPDCTPNIFHPIGSCAGGFGCSFSKEYYIDMFKSSDYVIDDNREPVLTGNSRIDLEGFKHHALQKSVFQELKKQFKLINKVEDKDGYSVYIYKKIK